MKKILFIMLVCCFPLISIAQTSLNGFYIGLEEMCSTDSAGLKECYTDAGHPERKWYHLTQMTIHGDSIFWSQSLISVYKKTPCIQHRMELFIITKESLTGTKIY
ncbi:hypothetical protein SAMN05518672_108189 [Chitinophaga sp. CF118]|uniref:hypothetical protein n=1 Tax=Chitinophaga sp. CF118 TaxID=1884367 RepID=UPI0008F3C67E|nr:hypothetical protein [Chitinophaga sp. CF118]SFE63595.1 hypothetical protein SAMN05518672_108189 [Chitinophaga sp. CF118]